MRNMKWPALGSLVLAIGAAGYGLHAWRAPEPSSRALQDLQQRVAALERRNGDVGDSPGRPWLSPAYTQPPPVGAAKGSARVDDPRVSRKSIGEQPPPPEEIARRQLVRRTQLDAQFRHEPVDADWAKRAEAALVAAASSDEIVHSGIVPQAISTECRASTCRIVTKFPADGDAEGWMNFYILGAAQTLAQSEVLLSRGADGRMELAIYGRRP